MVARVLVVSLAVVLAGFAAIDLSDHRDCYEDSVALVQLRLGVERPITDGFIDEYLGKCRGGRQLAVAAAVLVEEGRLDQAARLADEAIRREPEHHAGWVALERTLRARGSKAAADRALREVRRLNPRFERGPG